MGSVSDLLFLSPISPLVVRVGLSILVQKSKPQLFLVKGTMFIPDIVVRSWRRSEEIS